MSLVHTMHEKSSTHSIKNARKELLVYCEGCPNRPYVEIQIPPSIQHVQKVVFRTLSCDQGFSDMQNQLRGTYKETYSWFDVGVLKPSGHLRLSRRLLQRNMHAEGKMRWHINVWDVDETQDNDLRNWLQAIRSQDTIQVIPVTRHPAWRNYVAEVEIEVYGDASQNRGLPPLEARLLASAQDQPTGSSVSTLHRLDPIPKEIRLLTLNPGTRDEPLSGTLTVVSLLSDAKPKFQCLSYCWGDLANTTIIKLLQASHTDRNDEITALDLLITTNLASALLRLRLPDTSLTLWIDAICIDQDNPTERAEQVARLRDIYAQAENVIVWLGPSNEVTERHIYASKAVMKYYAENQIPSEGVANERYWKPHDPLWEGKQSSYYIDSPIMEYEWFRRAWVLQEVYLARNVLVLCGNHILPWSLILRLNACLNATMTNSLTPLYKNVMPRLFASLFELNDNPMTLDGTEAYETIQDKSSILDVIIGGLDLDTSDPRDKIFALLSFGKDTSDVESLPSEILPNYTKSPARVFADFTRWWIAENRSLKILSAIHASQGRTWVRMTTACMEFDDRPTWAIWYDGQSVWTQATLASDKSYGWNASRGAIVDANFYLNYADYTMLHLKGRLIGTIRDIQHYPILGFYQEQQNSEDDSSCWHKEMTEVYQYVCDPINRRGTWSSSIQQVTDPEHIDESQLRIHRAMTDHFIAHATNGHVGTFDCHDPCFFHTDDGLVGLCPYQAKVGDEIIVLYGGTVPFIVRNLEKETNNDAEEMTRMLVGECYLNDYMHGRAVSEKSGDHYRFREAIFALI